MKRFAEAFFAEWLEKPKRKPLVIRGARQVGKSTLVRQCAKAENRVLYEVNLERYPALQPVFATLDPDRILKEIELAIRSGPINPAESILFIDEIQEIPEAIAALRYFYEEMPALPVVAAGSLLEFTLSNHSFSMPVGRVEYFHLGPMCFGEFLAAQGRDDLADYLKSFKAVADFSPVAHETLSDLLRDFLFTGGMPEAVEAYRESGGPAAVREVHFSILNTYRDDFAKYGDKSSLPILRRVFDNVPSSVGAKFVHTAVNREWRAGAIRAAVDLLAQAGVIHRVHHASGAGLPLGASMETTMFKPLFLDVGLMNAACGLGPITLEQFRSHRFIDEGAMAEQFVGQHLLFAGLATARPSLHYWLREGKSSNAEVDYLVQAGYTVVPVEVKSGTSGSLRSLHQFAAAYGTPLALRFDLNPPSLQHVRHTALVAGGKKEVSFHLLSLPLYMAERGVEIARRLVDRLREGTGSAV